MSTMMVEVECKGCGKVREFEVEYISGEAGVGIPNGWYVCGPSDTVCGEIVADDFDVAPTSEMNAVEYFECDEVFEDRDVVEAAMICAFD